MKAAAELSDDRTFLMCYNQENKQEGETNVKHSYDKHGKDTTLPGGCESDSERKHASGVPASSQPGVFRDC